MASFYYVWGMTMNKDAILTKQLKDKYGDEKVFVVPMNIVENIPDKFTKQKHSNDIWSKYDNLGKFIMRYDAEYNPVFQQIIPYFLICNEDESKFFVAERLQGDNRLKGKLSLGFGGHINECDGPIEVVLHALVREMEEELNINPTSKAIYLGTMRDITSSTNDHLGLIFAVKAKEGQVFIRETDNLEGKWMTQEEMFNGYGRFEGWSKYIIDYLYQEYNKK